jgi:hypothetical protein
MPICESLQTPRIIRELALIWISLPRGGTDGYEAETLFSDILLLPSTTTRSGLVRDLDPKPHINANGIITPGFLCLPLSVDLNWSHILGYPTYGL